MISTRQKISRKQYAKNHQDPKFKKQNRKRSARWQSDHTNQYHHYQSEYALNHVEKSRRRARKYYWSHRQKCLARARVRNQTKSAKRKHRMYQHRYYYRHHAEIRARQSIRHHKKVLAEHPEWQHIHQSSLSEFVKSEA